MRGRSTQTRLRALDISVDDTSLRQMDARTHSDTLQSALSEPEVSKTTNLTSHGAALHDLGNALGGVDACTIEMNACGGHVRPRALQACKGEKSRKKKSCVTTLPTPKAAFRACPVAAPLTVEFVVYLEKPGSILYDKIILGKRESKSRAPQPSDELLGQQKPSAIALINVGRIRKVRSCDLNNSCEQCHESNRGSSGRAEVQAMHRDCR